MWFTPNWRRPTALPSCASRRPSNSAALTASGTSVPDAVKAALFEGRREAQLGKAVGLRQFGVNHITLASGAYSALRHWHEAEDEFVYVLFGEVTLIDDNGTHRL